MKKNFAPLAFAVLFLFLGLNANAAVLVFWDTNGTAPGAGSDTPSGTWGADAYWNTAPDGTGTNNTSSYDNGNPVVFAAGNDATGAYTINVLNTVRSGDIHVDLGEVTFTGGPLNLDNSMDRLFSVGHKDENAIARYNVSLTGATNIIRYKRGIMIFGATNTYAGTTKIKGGILRLGAPQVIPLTSDLILANNDDSVAEWQNTPAVFDTGGFSQQLGSLLLNGTDSTVDRVIDFGNGTSALSFADSSTNDWSSFSVKIVNYTPGSDSLRFGTGSNGLTTAQLSQIHFMDFGDVPGKIDSQGFVTPDLPTITILSVARVGDNQTDLTWTSVPGRNYRLQYKENLNDASWTDLFPDVPAIDSTTTYSDTPATAATRYYRVALVP